MGANVMITSTRRAYVALGVVLAAIALPVLAATFNLFSPAAGILKGNPSTYVTTAATSADVVATFSGGAGCTGTNYLAANGTCQTAATTTVPGGATTQIQYNNAGAFAGSSDLAWQNGSRTLNIGATGNALIEPVSNSGTGRFLTIRSGASSLAGSQGGALDIRAGASNGSGNGASATFTGGLGGSTGQGGAAFLVGGPGGTTSGNAGSVQVNGGTPTDGNGGDVQVLGSDGAGTNRNGGSVTLFAGAATGSGTLGQISLQGGRGVIAGAPTGGAQGVGTINATGLFVNGVAVGGATAGANPTASVGLTAVNGVATTFLRSDGAPALSQSISPTWSGTHTFSNAPVVNVTSGFNLLSLSGNVANGNGIRIIETGVQDRGYLGFGSSTCVGGTNPVLCLAPGASGSVAIGNAGGSTINTTFGGSGGLVVGAATGGNQGAGTVNATGLFVNGTAVGASTTASTTFTMGGCSAGTTGSVNFYKIGKQVQVMWQNRTCTSTGGTQLLLAFTYPAGYEPNINNLQSAAVITNNNIEVLGKVIFSTSTCGGGICFQVVPSTTFTGTVGNYGVGNGVYGTASYNTN